MSNQQYFGSECRKKLKGGIDKVFNCVAPTLGANGRNCIYNKFSRVPIISNDGVSIAREVEPEDLGELQGANLIKQVAERTNDEAGDGTTTSIILAHSMIEEGMKLLDSDKNNKINPMKLRREMAEAAEKVVKELDKMAQSVDTLEELEQVATISVESSIMGKIIAKAIYDAGDSGIVYVNDSEQIGISTEKVEGYQFSQGMITPYLIKDIDRMETVLENDVAILITDIQLHLTKEFIGIIQSLVAQGVKDILVVCDEIHPDVIKFAVMNMAKGNFNLSLVKKPMQKDYLEDIAAVVGATAMTQNKGIVNPKLEYLGKAKKVVINQKTTTLFPDESKVEKMNEYVDSLKKQLENVGIENVVAKTKLQERIARLTGGVFMLNVGDKTEAESKYLRMKVDDAVNAVKAAQEEGIVVGGGMALYRIAKSLFHEDDNTDGENIISCACHSPLGQIVYNSGEDLGLIIASFIDKDSGFNALTLQIESNMIGAGIIDPVKVTKAAFENAAGFAGLLLTTESLISPIPEVDNGLVNRKLV